MDRECKKFLRSFEKIATIFSKNIDKKESTPLIEEAVVNEYFNIRSEFSKKYPNVLRDVKKENYFSHNIGLRGSDSLYYTDQLLACINHDIECIRSGYSNLFDKTGDFLKRHPEILRLSMNNPLIYIAILLIGLIITIIFKS